ncbi:MAG: hypothetical protein ACTHKD_04955, partial [Devosia sp.]
MGYLNLVPTIALSPVTLALDRMVDAGALKADALQSAAARALDRIAEEVGQRGLFGRRKPVRG